VSWATAGATPAPNATRRDRHDNANTTRNGTAESFRVGGKLDIDTTSAPEKVHACHVSRNWSAADSHRVTSTCLVADPGKEEGARKPLLYDR
jgi:hypothetical protein